MRHPLQARHLAVAVALAVGCTEATLDTTAPANTPAVLRQEVSQSFAAGSLIIPMDTTYQDSGMLKAFGLVYQLIKQGVPVHWVIASGKSLGGVDFTASATDWQTGAAISNHGYRGGPFVIDSANRAAATPIINAWHAATNVTTVHSATAAFTGNVVRTLTAAPKIGVFVDNNEIIAFRYLNAAGITDSTGQAWPTATDATGVYTGYPDVLSDAEVRGATSTGAADGVLLRSDGTPAFCQLTSMHYTPPGDNEVVREVRMWLSSGPVPHAYMECDAIDSFENNVNGRFLTTLGITDDGGRPNPLTNLTPDNTFAQYDGPLSSAGGSIAALAVTGGSQYHANSTVLINQTGQPITRKAMWLTGHLDGNTAKGKVSYLTGHQYSTAVPVTGNNQANGVRLFLNSLFESPCTTAAGQPAISLTKSAPALTNQSTITFTLSYANTGPGVAENAVLEDTLPAGTTFVSATGGGTFSAGKVTWNLGNLGPGASGSVSFTVSVTTDGSYPNQATMTWNVFLTSQTAQSNTTTTVRDTVEPDTVIDSGPPASSNSASAAFDFSSPESGVTFECRLDGAATFTACTDPVTFTGLTDGTHTLEVRAVDAAGNVDTSPATHNWTVDTTPPAAPLITSPADGSTTSNFTPTFTGTAEPGAIVRVIVDGVLLGTTVADASGNWTFTPSSPLTSGPHSVAAVAVDGVGNVGPSSATINFTVDATDAGAADAGSGDAGAADAGAGDGGEADAGAG
ncbi:MAG: Ig-like domain-containing protein, partial [Myxococcota bacterium]